MADDTRRRRVLIAKLGLDGHDVGAKAIVFFLRDAGYEVIYLGIRQQPAHIVRVALDEDVDLIGLSMLSGAHMALVPRVVELLREQGEDIPVILGGTIPPEDVEPLRTAGVRAVFTPGSSLAEIEETIARLIDGKEVATAPA